MFEIIKTALNNGGYNLTNTLKKIDSLWVQGKLTENEYNELVVLARTNANANEDVDLIAKVAELEKRIAILEEKEAINIENPVTQYSEGKWYYNGDKCIWNGNTYICTAPEGVACVWSPEAYPSYWELIIEG